MNRKQRRQAIKTIKGEIKELFNKYSPPTSLFVSLSKEDQELLKEGNYPDEEVQRKYNVGAKLFDKIMEKEAEIRLILNKRV